MPPGCGTPPDPYFVDDADRLYNAWLETRVPATDPKWAAAIGYRSVMAHETTSDSANPLLGRLYERSPLAIATAYADRIEEQSPAKALAVVRKAALAANPHEIELWRARLRLDKAGKAETWAEAQKVLSPEHLDRLKVFAP